MKETNNHDTCSTMFHWHSLRFKLVFEGIVVGILSGLIVILYRFLLEKSTNKA